jgi:hypothetical protein
MKISQENHKVVLWGWKDYSNTFHYIHYAYNKAFKYLGYDTYWFDNNTDVSNFDFKNTLFFTEGQVDKNIPLRNDCFYVLHNCYDEKYNPLFENGKAFRMQTYTDDALKYKTTKIDECIHADYEGKCIYFPWATDLLPHEVEANKPSKVFNNESKYVHWVGTIGGERFGNIDQITPFKNACQVNGITFTNRMLVSNEENMRLIKESYMSPTIVGKWQHEVGYVPCRIFKNISYGQMGVTSSPRIYELFDHKVIYNDDTNQLFYDARNRLSTMLLAELHLLMDIVKEKHTYLNRIKTVLDFIQY